MTKDPPCVVVVAGPTASGKSALALCLAEALAGVIVNADSIQCYRDLAILTARPSAADERRAPHRLYGFLGPDEILSAAAWAGRAAGEIAAVLAAGRRPIVTGGTGLYLKALMEGLAAIPPIPDDVRAEARARLERIGPQEMHAQLAARDPETAARLKPGDGQRIARAWEVLEATGAPISQWQTQATTPAFAATYVRLLVYPPRDVLYAACDARFDAMVAAGALDQVAALRAGGLSPDAPVMRALGAKELSQALAGDLSLRAAAGLAKTQTRQYAKRQSTWFRHQFQSDLRLDSQFSESLFLEIFPEIRRLLLTC